MKHALACFLFLLAASTSAGTSTTLKPTTTDNDDSCDISLLPAATRLYVSELVGGPSQVRIFDLSGRSLGMVPLKEVSTVSELVR